MMETQTCAGLVSALEGRAAFYDVVAALYYKPLAQEQIDHIAEGGLAAFAGAGELMAEGLHDMERALSKRHSGTRQELAVDFTGAFAGTSSWKGRYATPYESVFTSEEGLLFQDSYHEVYRLYRQNSVRKSPGYDFPDDHLSYLCEFQALLASRAVRALETNVAECALEQVRLAQHVLHDHILSWFDDFEELALHLVKTRFYRGVLKMSKGFFLFDAEVLADMAEELERL